MTCKPVFTSNALQETSHYSIIVFTILWKVNMLNNIGLPGVILIVLVFMLVVRVLSASARQSTSRAVTDPPITVSNSEQVEKSIISGKCYVIDGDTIAIRKQKIRLAGINAPELNEPYGKQAKWAMVELCKGQNISAHLTGETSYDRVVAKCFLDDGRDLAAEMVKKELALDIPHFPNADYKHLETPNSRRKLNWRPKVN